MIPTHLKNYLTSSRERDVYSSTVHLLSSLKFSFGVCEMVILNSMPWMNNFVSQGPYSRTSYDIS